ncbi:MAG: DUF3341 domain-containing protein [Ignavibacteria bacterium]|nr:DUF3341 domain-containing protein [Ignavibacteria bacterium]MBP6510629.1 DUF3341 domain-containing protein [Candidatus Kapabacteria bacterium]HLP28195.1 DUF3341 domain-containing protein [Candidatus Didemnitutus sp.]MBK6417836.1 DUF3341 domain-containing protein [Ignavibacteria bacterium]MBK6760865.1 DUF3341 domain-containing protein [Ignavibacteria bacterium]
MSTTPVGVIGEFTEVNAAYAAAEKLRDAGFRNWDIHTPYPVHGLDKAMGVKRSIITYISFLGLVGGLSTAVGLQLWTGAIDYKLNIGGKGFFDWQFSIPIDFELSILGTAIMTVVGLFHLCRLPTWYNKYQEDESFKKATDDTFVVTIDSDDDRFSADGTQDMLRGLGAVNVHLVNASAE